MTKKVTVILSILFSAFLFTEVSAQSAPNVYFTGVGRAVVASSGLSDNTQNPNPSLPPPGKQKSSAGYTLFDLGIYAKPNEVLRGGVILRTKNEFGGFYGDGGALTFRQMQLEGLISKKVKYEIGDVYLTHTKYTLWAGDSLENKYEGKLFSMRRDIVNYENFYVGNAWRMQGINAKGKINFSKGVESLGIRFYGGRTKQTPDFMTIPDRYFYGGRLDLMQSKYFRIAGNIASVSDMSGTVKNPAFVYSNIVYTSDFDFTVDGDKIKIGINGEFGSSNLQVKRTIDTTNKKFSDYFYDLGAKATYKPINFTLAASYRNVGANFNSPMAQSRRMAAPSDVKLSNFPTSNNGGAARQISLFDMYSQEQNMYNQSISTTLMNYYIQYNIVEPYGRATPNRQGITIDADVKDQKGIFTGSVDVNLLTEVVSQGDSLTHAKRKFTLIRGGGVFNLSKLLEYEKLIAINFGVKTESSVRGGSNPVNLASSLIDLGLDVEVLNSLHLLGGAKFFNVKGNEIQTQRDAFNQISGYGTGVQFNQTQNIIATGVRYDYDKTGYFSIHYHIVKLNDKLTPSGTYNLNQLFFVFGLKF
ncbi:MAG TPA: hypothetical protein VNW06_07255 [Cytophagaceae bacterium]|nr:hypothetical protein [Cytophagaceae bacterium]